MSPREDRIMTFQAMLPIRYISVLLRYVRVQADSIEAPPMYNMSDLLLTSTLSPRSFVFHDWV